MSGDGLLDRDDVADSSALPPRDTIAALSTAPGRAAIAVIRLSGPQAGAALDTLAGGRPSPRRAALTTFRDPRDGAAIDRGLALFFPGSASATGEDMAELQVHGGRAVVAAMLDAVLAVPGVRLAEAGEFTRRAFLAGRMDLSEVEGLSDLIAADTEAQRRQALLQSEGALSAAVDRLRGRLVGAMALIEAGIDFSDEDDVTEAARSQARDEVAALAEDLAAALADRRAERLRDGFRVAILGRPNAGKSSLLNALARREAAIVSATPGTTRDVVEVHLDLDGLPVTLADTAGLREAGDEVEQEGVRRALARAADADLVLWIEDATARSEPDAAGAARIWRVVNKADLSTPDGEADHVIAATTGAGVDALLAALTKAARDSLSSGDGPALTRARHRDAFAAGLDFVQRALAEWDGLPDELLAEFLRGAAAELGRVTGRIGVEDVLDRLFASFCIGK